MADIKSREKAQKMRRQGKSINEITNRLNKPKSTVAYWCRDVALTKEQKIKLNNKRKRAGKLAFIKNAEEKSLKHRKLLKKNHTIGVNKVEKLSKRDLDMLCVGLYWGEGYKTGNGEFGFTNSDASMIKLYLRWLYEVHNVSEDRIILRISINESHKYRINDVLEFWSNITKIPKRQFTKTSLIKSKSKKIYSNHNNHMGTLRVKVSGGADLRAQVIGSISALC